VRDTSKLKAWETVAKEAFKRKRLRDKLAHWTVVAGPSKPDGYTAYLRPHDRPRAQTVLNNPRDAMNADDLKSRMLEFGHASGAI
jgi:hypothetical protein